MIMHKILKNIEFYLVSILFYMDWIDEFTGDTLREKCANTVYFLVCIFQYSYWKQRFYDKSPDSLQMRENMDQRKTRFQALFTQWQLVNFHI